MASGLQGQRFAFLGYLPIDAQQRHRAIQKLEQDSASRDETQIIIETPYRNIQLWEVLISTLAEETLLSVGLDLTGLKQWTQTRTVAQWRCLPTPDMHRTPAVFCCYKQEKHLSSAKLASKNQATIKHSPSAKRPRKGNARKPTQRG